MTDEGYKNTAILPGAFTLNKRCSAPAPLAANGGAYVGCRHDPGHDGDHEAIFIWSNGRNKDETST